MSTIYTLRTDPEVEAALDSLGVTPGNRSRVIRQAIIFLALHEREGSEAAEARHSLFKLNEILSGLRESIDALEVMSRGQ